MKGSPMTKQELRDQRRAERYLILNKTLRITDSFKHPRHLKRFWRSTGLCPVRSQPGLFIVPAEERYINLRDFRESSTYETFELPPPGPGTNFIFFSELRQKSD